MKKFLMMFFVAGMAFILQGCLMTENKLSGLDTLAADNPFVGYWLEEPGETSSYLKAQSIFYHAETNQLLVYDSSVRAFTWDEVNSPDFTMGFETSAYEFFPSTVEEKTFLSIANRNNTEEPIIYTIMKYVMSDDKNEMTLWNVDETILDEAIRDGVISATYPDGEKTPLVTSDADALANWIASLDDTKFKFYGRYNRWINDVDGLTKHLEEYKKVSH